MGYFFYVLFRNKQRHECQLVFCHPTVHKKKKIDIARLCGKCVLQYLNSLDFLGLLKKGKNYCLDSVQPTQKKSREKQKSAAGKNHSLEEEQVMISTISLFNQQHSQSGGMYQERSR